MSYISGTSIRATSSPRQCGEVTSYPELPGEMEAGATHKHGSGKSFLASDSLEGKASALVVAA